MDDGISTSDLQNAPEEVHELPPSAKLTYLVLKEIQPATHQDLCDRTTMPERTVRHAMSKLIQSDLVERRKNVRDPRKKVYTLRE